MYIVFCGDYIICSAVNMLLEFAQMIINLGHVEAICPQPLAIQHALFSSQLLLY